MEWFEQLGATIEARWNDRRRELAAWPALAASALAEARPCDHLTMTDVLDWAVQTERFPAQLDPAGNFGQPPITVYAGAHFVIDVLLWIDGILAIHQHAFSGAFHVLDGSSLHTTYHFEDRSRLSETMVIGRLVLERAEHLARGDTRPIASGRGLIHSLFHLDRPSATVVVRTVHDPGSSPQYEYRAPGLAMIATESLGPRGHDLVRRLRAIEALQLIDPQRAFARLTALLARCDAEPWFRAVERCLIKGWLTRPQFEAILADARPRLGALVETCRDVFEEILRTSSIDRHRAAIHDPQHRDFLALLLNLSGRRTILDFVARRYPGDPVDTVMRWIAELTVHRPPGRGAPPPLELELDEASLRVLRCLVEGLPWDALKDRLRDDYDDVDAQDADLAQLCAAFRSSRLFRSLLA